MTVAIIDKVDGERLIKDFGGTALYIDIQIEGETLGCFSQSGRQSWGSKKIYICREDLQDLISRKLKNDNH